MNEAEAEVEQARAQAEQEKQERRAHMQALLAEKADLEAALQHQRQAAKHLQVSVSGLHLEVCNKHWCGGCNCLEACRHSVEKPTAQVAYEWLFLLSIHEAECLLR